MEEPLEVLEAPDYEINRLFPKCSPRYFSSNPSSAITNLNFSTVQGSDDNENYRNNCFATPQPNCDEEVTSYDSSISRMSVDTASAITTSGSQSNASVSSSSSLSIHRDKSGEVPTASSYREREETRSSVLDSSFEEPQALPDATGNALRCDHYRLRDSRIQAAGGCEVYSQSKIRPSRKRYSEPRRSHGSHPFYYQNAHTSSHSSSQVNQLTRRKPIHLNELRHEINSSRSDTTTTSAESSFEDGESESSAPIEESSAANAESPVVYETQLAGSSEVVFDDIGEWVTRGLRVKGYSGDSREKSLTGSFSHSHSEQDSDTEEGHSFDRVKKIGNVPIAEYEGSPRRYGIRSSIRHHSPRSLYLLPPIHRIPRPGFPRRVSSSFEKNISKDTLNPNSLPVWNKSFSQRRDKNLFKTSSTRDKNSISKEKSRAKIRERRNGIKSKNREVPPEIGASSYNFNIIADNAIVDTKILKTDVPLEDPNIKGGYGFCYNYNTIPHEETEEIVSKKPTLSISTLASIYSAQDDKNNSKISEPIDVAAKMDLCSINSLALKYCDYEESETHKVLEEFFHGSYSKLSKQDFLDLEYTLKRHQGNSYVGQRLASEVDPEEMQELEFSKEKIDLINQLPCALNTAVDLSIADHSTLDAEIDTEVSQAYCLNHVQQITENTSSTSSLSCREGPSSKSSSDMPDINNFKTDTAFSFEVEKGYQEQGDNATTLHRAKNERVISDANIQLSARLDEITNPNCYITDRLPNDIHIPIKQSFDNIKDLEECVDDVQIQDFTNNTSLFREANMICTSNSLDCIIEPVTTREAQCYNDVHVAAQIESSRNLNLSPTTTCESVEAGSEYSIGELDGSVHSSLKGVCPTMPILEDGLSSGEESDSGVVISQSKLFTDTDVAHIVVGHPANEDTDYNNIYQTDLQKQFDSKNEVDMDIRDIVYEKSYQTRTRSFDDHLCRGELPVIGNRIVSNDIRRETANSHSHEHSVFLSQHSNSNHTFSFNVPECDAMLKHSTPYRNSQPSPSSSTLSLMKKQITEIEREIALKKPDCLSKKFCQDVMHPSLDIHMLDPLSEKLCESPPPPAPHPHRDSNDIEENGVSASGCTTPGYSGVIHSPEMVQDTIPGPQLLVAKGSVGSPVQAAHNLLSHLTQDGYQQPVTNSSPSRESVEAAIADIKMAIRKTKNVSLKNHRQERQDTDIGPVWIPRSRREFCDQSVASSPKEHPPQSNDQENSPSRESTRSRERSEDDGDTDQETDRLLGRQRSRDSGHINDKSWRNSTSSRASIQNYLTPNLKEIESDDGIGPNSRGSTTSTPVMQSHPIETIETPPTDDTPDLSKKEKEKIKKKGKSKEVLIEGVLFRARYLGSTQLVSEGQPTKTTRMMQAEEAVSRIKALAPEGEPQPSTEVDLFISTEKIMVLNTDLKEIMMDHALRTISYIADIGDLVVLMARRRVLPSDELPGEGGSKTPKMICHVFESDEAQFIAQSIGQAFQVAYLEFLKANGIEDHSFVKEMDYQEVLNSQEIFGDELQMFAKKELQKEVVVPKMKGDILGVVVVESGWGSMVPTVVIANLSPTGAAAKCGQMNIGDQIIAINGVSLVGLPLSTCQNYIKNTKYNTAVKLTVVPCPPVVEVKIRRPDTKYQLGFSVQNGVICSLLRGGIAERGGVRVGHRIIDINSQSVVAVPHEKIVNLLATSVGEIRMKTMPTSIFRLLTGQETPQYI